MSMNIKEYIGKSLLIQEKLLYYIDSEDNVEENYQTLKLLISEHQIEKNNHELKLLLELINIITNNHKRTAFLFDKIAKLFTDFNKEIKKFFSNKDIFDIFKNNKRILLTLIKADILIIDQLVLSLMSEDKYRKFKYPEYFYLPGFNIGSDNEFDQKRYIGENDLFICKLIREDNIDKFTELIAESKFPLNSIIQPSVFETHQLLLKKAPSLIEYSAFFGSIRIFNFLLSNKVKTTSSLWEYAIHSNNRQIIDLLINFEIEPMDKTYDKCLKESIKCHHTDITNYIQTNLISESTESYNLKNIYNHNIYYYSFHYHNYMYLSPDLNHNFAFFYLCEFGYYKLVDIFLKSKKADLNETIIYKFFT